MSSVARPGSTRFGPSLGSRVGVQVSEVGTRGAGRTNGSIRQDFDGMSTGTSQATCSAARLRNINTAEANFESLFDDGVVGVFTLPPPELALVP
jgi:hypothetical protein